MTRYIAFVKIITNKTHRIYFCDGYILRNRVCKWKRMWMNFMITEKNGETIKNNLVKALKVNLPTLRKKYGISQADLGEKVGLSRQTISGIERGSIEMSWTVYLAIVCYFVMKNDNLFLFSDELDCEGIDLNLVQHYLKSENNG